MDYILGAGSTLASIAVAWLLQRRSEHQKWVRDVRRVAYSQFLDASGRFVRAAAALEAANRGDPTADPAPIAAESMKEARKLLHDRFGEVLLLASDDAASLASGLIEQVGRLTRFARSGGRLAEDEPDPYEVFDKLRGRLLSQFRGDLKV